MRVSLSISLITSSIMATMVLCGCSSGNTEQASQERKTDTQPRGAENLAYRWGTVALEATANDTENNKPRPPVNSRMLALPMIAQFDAWSRYDDKAMPVHLDGVERRPANERTLENRSKAISFAMCRALTEIFPADSMLYRNFMMELGYDPDDRSLDPTTPEGIGNLAVRTTMEKCREDGSNQYGDHPGAQGTAYGDYTHYRPRNTEDRLDDIDRWQPKFFTRPDGGRWAPGCLAPHWGHVKPFALESPAQFRPAPPPYMGDPVLEREIREVVAVQASLTNEEKALVEFMRDGPRSVQQAGHWLIFARDVSRRDHHTLDDEVKMYFLVTTVAMDCFIACWDAKMHYDNSRPYQQVHHLMGDEDIMGWGGPHKGMVAMKGRDWRPYSPDDFLCPPFPAYPSGHSTVSGGCAEALKLFTGSDQYGEEVRLMPGWLTEPGITEDSITLKFPTFTSTAEQAGWSRVLGGYHIQTDNVVGLELGRQVARVVHARCMAHINGTEAQMAAGK